jgi:predicted glycosyltransferase
MIFGGYNSLMDVLHVGIPATVIVREMQDGEQQLHLERLQAKDPGRFLSLREGEADGQTLAKAILDRLDTASTRPKGVDLDGGQAAARYLVSCLS